LDKHGYGKLSGLVSLDSVMCWVQVDMGLASCQTQRP
jgi:hypothetical protein